jgi:hypothetical protein
MTRNQLLELFAIGDPLGRRILNDPISAISGGIGMVGNIVGGITGNSAANKAGKLQEAAGNKAAADVTAATNAANPQIAAAADKAGTLAQAGAAGVTTAAGNAAATSTRNTGEANAILDPYSHAGQAAAGTLQSGLAAGGDFNKTPTMADLQMDPGYAFRLQQGQDALARSAAARGGAISGSALKDLTTYAQGSASQEYQNAFNRYQTDTQGRYGRLFGVSQEGQAAGVQQGNNLTADARYGGNITTAAADTQLAANEYTGTAGTNAADLMASNTIGTAKTAADYQTGGAAARAGGIVGGANALTNGINGAANAAGGALSLSKLLKNPALNPINGSPLTPQVSVAGMVP